MPVCASIPDGQVRLTVPRGTVCPLYFLAVSCNNYIMENQTQLLQLAQDLGLNPVLQADLSRPCWVKSHVNGVKFEIEQTRGGQWRLILAYDDVPNGEILREAYPSCLARKNGVVILCSDFEELEMASYDARQFIIENGLGRATRPVAQTGITFEDTNFAGYGERDFMAALVQIQKAGYATTIPGVGSNLGFEYQVPSTGSRIDAVEFDSTGSVVTVIECQSGIQSGSYLDDEHFAKAISRYPQSEEIRNTVKKIVIIAGGYSAEQLATLAQLPYEIVALKTAVVDGKVVLEVVG